MQKCEFNISQYDNVLLVNTDHNHMKNNIKKNINNFKDKTELLKKNYIQICYTK